MAHRLRVLSGHLEAEKTNSLSASSCSKQRMQRSPITTHVLDTALGRPARGVPIQLSYSTAWDGSNWVQIATGSTDDDGRCSTLLPPGNLKPGTYRVRFDTNTYFASIDNHKPFYPYVEVVFVLEDPSQHYHIPLLLSPFSYSTYRGS